jgi:D-methionine transport system ATP-binding protein
VIRALKVSKVFASTEGPLHALRDVDLDIESGEIFGIIGRSGAGKSTLLRVLNLLERPTSGEVLLEEQPITTLHGAPLRCLRQQIGMVFQHFNLLNSRSAEENVRLPLRVAGNLSEAAQWQRVQELLDLVGLADHGRKYPLQLSGGERQRVGIARALANKPKLLLCDEPTSALDPQTTQSILELLSDINRRLKLTIVLITHSMDVIRKLADRVAVLEKGQVVESGRVLDVFLEPKHPTTRSLLAESGIETERGPAAAPRPGARVLRLTYRGDVVATPVLTALARELAIDLCLLQGSIGRIRDTPYAELTVAVESSAEQLDQLVQSLARRDVRCEMLLS